MKLRAVFYALIISILPLAAAECSTLEAVRADVAKRGPLANIVEMDKKETEAFLEVYNAIPPASDFRGDYSVAISYSTYPLVMYVSFLDNCVVATRYMTREFYESVMEVALPKPQGQKA